MHAGRGGLMMVGAAPIGGRFRCRRRVRKEPSVVNKACRTMDCTRYRLMIQFAKAHSSSSWAASSSTSSREEEWRCVIGCPWLAPAAPVAMPGQDDLVLHAPIADLMAVAMIEK
jgi:hypothetical protein